MATATAATPAPQLTPEQAVAIRDFLVSNIRREFSTTKKVIAAIPENKKDHRHDAKSKTAHELAWHIVSADVGLAEAIAAGSFAGLDGPRPAAPATVAEINAWYDKHFPGALEKVAKLDGKQLLSMIDFRGLIQMPALQFVMTLLNNHSVHHRAQLSTYLRPMGSKCPSIYGPSADTPVGA